MNKEPAIQSLRQMCLSAMDGYRKCLTEISPDYKLVDYCKERDIPYRKMVDWMSRNGYKVKDMKRDLFASDGASSPGTFLQFTPSAPSLESCDSQLKGVGIVFPDGVSLSLQECSCESVITLLEVYERRRSAREAECSR